MQLDTIIKEFGEIVGFQSLEINENGVVHLTINNVGELFIDEKYRDEAEDCIFVYLLRVYDRADGDLYKSALELCDYKKNAEFLVNPVLHHEQTLGFSVKCQTDEFDLNTLQKIIRILQELHDRLAGKSST